MLSARCLSPLRLTLAACLLAVGCLSTWAAPLKISKGGDVLEDPQVETERMIKSPGIEKEIGRTYERYLTVPNSANQAITIAILQERDNAKRRALKKRKQKESNSSEDPVAVQEEAEQPGEKETETPNILEAAQSFEAYQARQRSQSEDKKPKSNQPAPTQGREGIAQDNDFGFSALKNDGNGISSRSGIGKSGSKTSDRSSGYSTAGVADRSSLPSSLIADGTSRDLQGLSFEAKSAARFGVTRPAPSSRNTRESSPSSFESSGLGRGGSISLPGRAIAVPSASGFDRTPLPTQRYTPQPGVLSIPKRRAN